MWNINDFLLLLLCVHFVTIKTSKNENKKERESETMISSWIDCVDGRKKTEWKTVSENERKEK